MAHSMQHQMVKRRHNMKSLIALLFISLSCNAAIIKMTNLITSEIKTYDLSPYNKEE